MIKGKYQKRIVCRLCSSKQLSLFLNLGEMPLAGDFLFKEDIGTEPYYPLKLYRCLDCNLVQVLHIIPAKQLFKDYRYVSSVGLTDHFTRYAKEMVKKFNLKNKQILEIGSNDGVLIAPLKNLGAIVLGIDPAQNISKLAIEKGLPTIVAFFSTKIANELVKEYGKFTAIFANNVLAHIDGIEDIFRAITLLLEDTGVLVFEVHYLPSLLKRLQYDFFYHEHMSYYTITALKPFLEKLSLTIFDVKKISVHSGSIRVYVKHTKNGQIPISRNVNRLIQEEKLFFANNSVYKKFTQRITKQKEKLVKTLLDLKMNGATIVGYGASGRANTLLNFCDITSKVLDYIVDDSSERYGRYTPGTHIPIVSSNVLHTHNPDFIVIFAWNYKEMIIRKAEKYIKEGGSFIIPLPTVTLIKKKDE